jgi:hypothetical protein
VCTTKEPFDHDIDDAFDDIVDEKSKQPNKIAAGELEMPSSYRENADLVKREPSDDQVDGKVADE